jgi:diaminopimelate epimerase
MGLPLVKAHAYGNDFLLVAAGAVRALLGGPAGHDALARLAVAACDRHEGIGADGVIVYERHAGGAQMTLLNADGSPSELSGNGLRCLAALIARDERLAPGAAVTVETGAGPRALELLSRERERYTWRAAMGPADGIRRAAIPIGAESVPATVLRVGNPQCVVLGPLPDADRFSRLGPALSSHGMFPAGTNVEFAHVEAPDRVRILIWERGVGPTTSSGTGACAAAVAAAAHGGAARDVEVVAPGGVQRVEWRDEGIYLTGWAELVLEGTFLGTMSA